MNNFTMTCAVCDKTFTISDKNRHLWSRGTCDTCVRAKQKEVA
jgi:hypothetical protein